MDTLKQLRNIIQENNIIEEEKVGNITVFTFKDKKTKKEKGHINLVACDATVANYKTNNHWYTECDTMEVPSISVLSLSSEVKGTGKLLMGYGVLTMKERNPHIKYSNLDDMSNKSIHVVDNIYSRFGYTPTAAVEKTNVPNTIKLGGSEKQVLLDTFERKTRSYLLSPSQANSKVKTRGRTEKRSQRPKRSSGPRRSARLAGKKYGH
jgi:hypothetical protein